MTTTTLEFHEVADVFPLMEGPDFETFKADIEANGLKEPIWLHDGKIIDGRNRYRACEALGVEPEFREWDGEGDPTAFVVSLNLHRRHLTESQRGAIAARLKPRFQHEANERQAHGRTAPGRPLDPPAGGDGHDKTLSADLREASHVKASEKAAALLNVSPRLVESASKVLKNGVPELVKAVEKGQVKVSTAEAISTLPAQEQAAVVAQGPRATKQKAKEVKQERRAERRKQITEDPRARAEHFRQHFLKSLDSVDDLTRAVAAQVKHGGYGGFPAILALLTRSEGLRVAGKVETLIERLQEWVPQIREHYGE